MAFVKPPSGAMLKNYPQFESLHRKLTFSLLDKDGAIKSESCTELLHQVGLPSYRAANAHAQENVPSAGSSLLRVSLLFDSMESLVEDGNMSSKVSHQEAQDKNLDAERPRSNPSTPAHYQYCSKGLGDY